MSKTLYVGSTSRYAGKTLVTLALGHLLSQKNIAYSYFKPVGVSPQILNGRLIDEEALFIAQALGQEAPVEELCPVILTQDLIIGALRGTDQNLLQKVVSGHRHRLQSGHPVLASGSGGLYSGKFMGLSGLEVVRALGARVILVARYQGEDTLDEILRIREDLKDALVGVVFNGLNAAEQEGFRELVVPYCLSQGFKILGIIPHDDLLAAVSVADLRDLLGAKLICCPEEEGQLIEHFLIGGMQVDKAISYFRQTPNFGVIVGGDRSDILLAAIETGARGLILTGGLYPHQIIISQAEEHRVPILVVPDDTYTAARRIDHLQQRIRLRHPQKIEKVFELGERYLDTAPIEDYLR